MIQDNTVSILGWIQYEKGRWLQNNNPEVPGPGAMRIIISPAKQMRVDTDSLACTELPVFTDRAEILKDWIRSLSYQEQKTLWACNDKIARQNAERFAHMDLTKNLTPALLAYDGIQYTYMAPAVFEDGQFEYVQEHLRILSGFYGVVKRIRKVQGGEHI